MPKKITIIAILFLVLLADLIAVRHSIVFNQISNFDVLITLSFQVIIAVFLIVTLGILLLKSKSESRLF